MKILKIFVLFFLISGSNVAGAAENHVWDIDALLGNTGNVTLEANGNFVTTIPASRLKMYESIRQGIYSQTGIPKATFFR